MRVGNASAEMGFSQLVPDGDSDQNEDLRNLLRSLEQACSQKDKEAVLRACRNISRESEAAQSWSEWLEALIEREFDPGECPDYGTAAFRRLRPKIVAEWRSRQGSPPTN